MARTTEFCKLEELILMKKIVSEESETWISRTRHCSRLWFLLQRCNTIEVKVPACLGKGEARPSRIQHRRCKPIRRGRAPCCCWLRLLRANPARQIYAKNAAVLRDVPEDFAT